MLRAAILSCVLLALAGAGAFALEVPHIAQQLRPWIAKVETLRTETEHQSAAREGLAPGFIASLRLFAEETMGLAGTLRGLPEGEEPACILQGIALDLALKAGHLATAATPDEVASALAGLGQLLAEPLLIFGEPDRAAAAPRLEPAAMSGPAIPDCGLQGAA